MNTIAEWIKGTAVHMEVIPPFGAVHLTIVIAGTAVALLLALALRRTSGRAVLLAVGLVLLLSEVYKQLFWYYAVGYALYPFRIFPFHPCSMPMYFCVPAALMREGRNRQTLVDFMACYCLIGGFASLFVPEGLTYSYLPLTIHAFAWHLMLTFLGLWLGLSGQVGRKGGFGGVFALYVGLCLAAFYINVGFWNASGGTIDMFFVGPAPMTVAVYSDIAAVIGRLPVTLFFMATYSLGAYAFFRLFRLFGEKRRIPAPADGLRGRRA